MFLLAVKITPGAKKVRVKLNRRWHISTTPHTTKIFCTLFKLIQPSNMVTLSCLAKKNWNLNPRKKSSVYYWKLIFHATNFSIFNNKLNFFFLSFKFWFFFERQLRVTILECCISLNSVKNFLAVLGVVDMCHLLLKMVSKRRLSCLLLHFSVKQSICFLMPDLLTNQKAGFWNLVWLKKKETPQISSFL